MTPTTAPPREAHRAEAQTLNDLRKLAARLRPDGEYRRGLRRVVFAIVEHDQEHARSLELLRQLRGELDQHRPMRSLFRQVAVDVEARWPEYSSAQHTAITGLMSEIRAGFDELTADAQRVHDNVDGEFAATTQLIMDRLGHAGRELAVLETNVTEAAA